ncbi:MAG: oligosaccharide flippase family protein [Bacteroidetes bacterium]|jgi:O-antigen/teichoic acid export membrane protein|nr:oligosaccharide flippase family protein [Bacteroidota bacterium]
MLKQRFVVQFGAQFGVKILSMVAGLVVARIAGPEVIGIIAFGTAYISIWSFFTGLFGTGHIKLISEGKPLDRCMTTYTWLQGGGVAVFVLAVLGAFFFQKAFFDAFESRTHEIVILLLLLANLIDQALNFGNTTFTAKLEQAKANYPLVVKAVLYHAARIAIVFLGFKAVGLASVNLIAALVALPLVWRLLRKLEFGSFDQDLLKEHLQYALPIFLIVVINAITAYSDKLLLAHYTDTKELGYYSAAFSIGGIFLLISRSVGTVFFPLFSGLIADKNWDAVNQRIRSFQHFAAFFIFPGICLLALIGAPFLTTLLGEKYGPSVLPFKILLFATYISIVGMPYGNVITGMGRFYLNVLINFIGLVVFLVAVYLLINPAYLGLGATGIAINLLVLNIVHNLLFLYYSSRVGGVKPNFATLAPYSLVITVSLGFAFLEPALSEWNRWWWLAIIPVYIVIIYPLFYGLGILTKADIAKFVDILNLKKLLSYVSKEFKDEG